MSVQTANCKLWNLVFDASLIFELWCLKFTSDGGVA
jgi:hypothetical protein